MRPVRPARKIAGINREDEFVFNRWRSWTKNTNVHVCKYCMNNKKNRGFSKAIKYRPYRKTGVDSF